MNDNLAILSSLVGYDVIANVRIPSLADRRFNWCEGATTVLFILIDNYIFLLYTLDEKIFVVFRETVVVGR